MLKFLGYILTIMYSTALKGFVLSVVYNSHLAIFFGIGKLSVVTGCAVMAITGFMTNHSPSKGEEPRDVSFRLSFLTLYSALVLAISYGLTFF